MAAISSAISSLSLGDGSSNAGLVKMLDEDKFQDALTQIGHPKKTPQGQLALYAAYALYRLGREEECLQLLQAKDVTDSRGAQHLRAQAYYRLERTQDALAVYDTLQAREAKGLVVNEKEDTEVNVLALRAQDSLVHGRQNPALEGDSKPNANSSHELLFNYAVLLTSQNKRSEALEALGHTKAALQRLRLSSTDYDYEVGPILAQEAHLTGDRSLNQQVAALKTDKTTTILNTLALEVGDSELAKNPYHVYKAFSSVPKDNARLFSYQERYIEYDRILAAHEIGQSVKNAAQKYCKKFSGVDPQRCIALQSLLHSRASNLSLKEIAADENRSDSDRASSVISLIGRLVRKPGGVAKSLSLLDSFKLPQMPGIVALRCSLLDLIGKAADASSTAYLQQCLANATANGPERVELLAGSIQRQVSSRKPLNQEQTTALRAQIEELLALDPTNTVGLAARSVIDTASESITAQLPDLSSVDIAALELNLPLKRASEEEKSLRKKRKKTIPASGIDAVNEAKSDTTKKGLAPTTLDPDRWLPKRDRASYRPSKKDKTRSNAHQGGIVDESLGGDGPMKGASAVNGGASESKPSAAKKKKKKSAGKK